MTLSSRDTRYSVSIIIPCRNERDNIEPTLSGVPVFGTRQEFIFVEGHSTDGTWDEIERVRAAYPGKDIKCLRQTGKGKGDALQAAFAVAGGEILIILDADLTVMPEETVSFYEALRDGRGDFINGSRLSGVMEKGAMPARNRMGNLIAAAFLSWRLGQKLTDTLCGTKAFFRKDFPPGRDEADDPYGDLALLFRAARTGLRIFEVPVHYRRRRYGASNFHRCNDTLQLIGLCLSRIFRNV